MMFPPCSCMHILASHSTITSITRKVKKPYVCVLASDGIKLTLFLGAGGLLCFGFRMRTTLIRHGRVSCCWSVLIISQGNFSFLQCPASKKLGGGRAIKSWKGTKPGQLPKLAREVSSTICQHVEL